MTGQVPALAQEAPMPGPVPQRTDQTVRRNIPDVPVDKLPVTGIVSIPPLDFVDPHPITLDLYKSLAESAQNRYYEPSDWQQARFALHFADQQLKSYKPSAQMVASIYQMFTDLLLSEGSRRRFRLEIERTPGTEGGVVLDVAGMFAQRLGLVPPVTETPEAS